MECRLPTHKHRHNYHDLVNQKKNVQKYEAINKI
jgi:hypothetical protein